MESLQTQNKQISFTEDQVALIKKQIAPKATDDELQLFLYQAKRTGLDPLTRQIYCIHRKQKFGNDWVDKMTIQTSIDGFRVIAERSGDYAGQDEPLFTETEKGLISCRITVYRFRGDTRYPAAVGLAYWSEYVQTDRDGRPTSMWAKMPHTMLAKVAEALALRKAYPQDLSGLYTGDEMQQASNIDVVVEEVDDIEELHKEYMRVYNEYAMQSPEDVSKYLPDNWKGERNSKNYKDATKALKARLDGLSRPAN